MSDILPGPECGQHERDENRHIPEMHLPNGYASDHPVNVS